MYRLEIVSGKKGPEPIVWSFFPTLVPTGHSEFYTIHAALSDKPLSDVHQQLLDGWIEEDFIVSWTCEEVAEDIPPGYVTTNMAAKMTGKSGSHWRNNAAAGKVPGAYKPGKDWLIPVSVIEHYNRSKEDDLVIIKAAGPGPAYVYIRRAGDSMSDPKDIRNHMLLSDEQEAAYWKAVQFIKDNQRDEALAVLKPLFDKAWIE